MDQSENNPSEESNLPDSGKSQKAALLVQNQADFELEFYQSILKVNPDYVDVLRVLGNLLTLKGKYAEGLAIDKRLVRLRPADALAHYNLACSYSLLKRIEMSLKTLRLAIQLGYSDFRYMKEDTDHESIRHDPRFRQLIKDGEGR